MKKPLLYRFAVVVVFIVGTSLSNEAALRQCGQQAQGVPITFLCDPATSLNSNIGTSGDDIVFGTVGDDDISTDGSQLTNTTLTGPAGLEAPANGGNDQVFAGAGGDAILTGTGDDTVMGNGGNDAICTGAGDDTVFPGAHTQNDDVSTSNTRAFIRGTSDPIIPSGVSPISFTDCGNVVEKPRASISNNGVFNPGEESTQLGPGDDHIWIFAGEIGRDAKMFVDCGPGFDTVNLVGYGPRGRVDIVDSNTVKAQISDPINGNPQRQTGLLVTVNCERFNGANDTLVFLA